MAKPTDAAADAVLFDLANLTQDAMERLSDGTWRRVFRLIAPGLARDRPGLLVPLLWRRAARMVHGHGIDPSGAERFAALMAEAGLGITAIPEGEGRP